MNNYLINLHDVTANARPCRCEPELLARCIDEAQTLDIKNDLGEGIYLQLFADPRPDNIALLWNGGEYTDTSGQPHVFSGLKKALCYYVYSRVCRASGAVVSRFDLVTKNDEYSNSVDAKRRASIVDDALRTADALKYECLQFVQKSGLFPATGVKMTNNRVRFRMIGK